MLVLSCLCLLSTPFGPIVGLSCYYKPILFFRALTLFSVSAVSPRIPNFVGDSARASAVISPAALRAAAAALSSTLVHAARWDLEAPHSRPSRWGVNIPPCRQMNHPRWGNDLTRQRRLAHLRLGGAPPTQNPHSRIPRWEVNNSIRSWGLSTEHQLNMNEVFRWSHRIYSLAACKEWESIWRSHQWHNHARLNETNVSLAITIKNTITDKKQKQCGWTGLDSTDPLRGPCSANKHIVATPYGEWIQGS